MGHVDTLQWPNRIRRNFTQITDSNSNIHEMFIVHKCTFIQCDGVMLTEQNIQLNEGGKSIVRSLRHSGCDVAFSLLQYIIRGHDVKDAVELIRMITSRRDIVTAEHKDQSEQKSHLIDKHRYLLGKVDIPNRTSPQNERSSGVKALNVEQLKESTKVSTLFIPICLSYTANTHIRVDISTKIHTLTPKKKSSEFFPQTIS